MASVNKVILVGTLGRDPDIKYMSDGQTAIANLSMATNYRQKDQQTGEYRDVAEWHRVTFIGRLAEVAKDYLFKGSSCYVEGRLQTRKYTDKQGIERYVTEVIGGTLQLLDKKADSQQQQTAQPQQAQQYQAQQQAPRPQAQYQQQAPAYNDGDVPF